MNCLAPYLSQLGPRVILDRREERRLIRQAQGGDAWALDTLIHAHGYYVVKVAKTFRKTCVPIEDLIQAGNIGLLKAIGRFKPRKRNNLLTYATHWIVREMVSLSRNNGFLIHRPSQWFWKHSRADMEARLDVTQLAALNNCIGPIRPARAESVTRDHRRVDTPENWDEEREWVDRALDLLPPTAREVIELRRHGGTFREIGARLGVSRQTAKNIEQTAIEQLRRLAQHPVSRELQPPPQ